MKQLSKNDVAIVVDTGHAITMSLKDFVRDLRDVKRFWEIDPENLQLSRSRPVFYIVGLGIAVDYFTVGLVLRCGFNTIYIKDQKQILSVCGSSLFDKDELKGGAEGGPALDRREGIGYIREFILTGCPITRDAFNRRAAYSQRMKKEADQFDQGHIIVGAEDFIDKGILKKQKPINNYEKKIRETTSYNQFCVDFLKNVAPEDMKEKKMEIDNMIIRPLEPEIYTLVDKLGEMDKYKDAYKKILKKHQVQYLKNMKQVYPRPMF